jgi:hypothetical protein
MPKCLRNDSKKQKWLPVPANRKGTYPYVLPLSSTKNKDASLPFPGSGTSPCRCSGEPTLLCIREIDKRVQVKWGPLHKETGFKEQMDSDAIATSRLKQQCLHWSMTRVTCHARQKRWTPMISTVGLHDDFFHAFRVRQTFSNHTCIPDDVYRIV